MKPFDRSTKGQNGMSYGTMNWAYSQNSGISKDAVKRCRLAVASRRRNRALSSFFVLVLSGWLLAIGQANATQTALEAMSYSSLPGDQLQLTLKFSDTPPQPLTFTIDNPARIALDFPNTTNSLKKRSLDIGVGVARSAHAAQANGRTRVVLNLAELAAYQTEIKGNELVLALGDAAPAGFGSVNTAATSSPAPATGVAASVTNIDFRRGVGGEGRIIITLSDPSIPVDLREQGGKILLDVVNAQVAANLERRLGGHHSGGLDRYQLPADAR